MIFLKTAPYITLCGFSSIIDKVGVVLYTITWKNEVRSAVMYNDTLSEYV